jgi:hypothetical protein
MLFNIPAVVIQENTYTVTATDDINPGTVTVYDELF